MRIGSKGIGRYSSYLAALWGSGFLLLLGGCASTLPESIRIAPEQQPTVDQVRQAPDQYDRAEVRWGGELVAVNNGRDSTELEILGRELYADGEPRVNSSAQGRFIARVQGFLDPADYQTGQLLTVAGRLQGVSEGKVGEFVYVYPMVIANQTHRWPEPLAAPAYPIYGWPYYGPYSGPWWPNRYHPWHSPIWW